MTPRTTVFVDAENVRRSIWPNVSRRELVELCDAWTLEHGVDAVVVFDGDAPDVGRSDRCTVVGTSGETADDWIVRATADADDFWLVTSDRELRTRAGDRAARTIGGGAFVRALRG